MRRFLVGLCVACVFLGALSGVASAQPAPVFKLGFLDMAQQIPTSVGTPLENEHYAPNGDSLQQTTKGLMVWRKYDNWTAFTNGTMTFINGPLGLQARLNSSLFTWEVVAAEKRAAESAAFKVTADRMLAEFRAKINAPYVPAPYVPITPPVSPGVSSGPESVAFVELDGSAVIVAADGAFLGKVTSNVYDSDSIINDYGEYGSLYSSTSIRNEYGEYGGRYSNQSPFNPYTSAPPKIVLGNRWVYLTVNRSISPRVDPGLLVAYLLSK